MACRKIALSEEQFERFNQDGFLIIEHLIDEQMLVQLSARFEPLFAGEFGLPDLRVRALVTTCHLKHRLAVNRSIRWQ